MERVHLVPSDEEDLYGDFTEFRPILTSSDRFRPQSSASKVPTTALRTAQSRGITTARSGTTTARPLTGVRGAGYTSGGPKTSSSGNPLDPLNRSHKNATIHLEPKPSDSPEEQVKATEQRIHELVEGSIIAQGKGDPRTALDKAKEASNKERTLMRQREQLGLNDNHSMDLTFLVLFNLGNQYAHNDLFAEALSTFQILTRNRLFANSGRLRLNIANLHSRLGQYAQALKHYRMALDQVPAQYTGLRVKIMHNIGLLFVKMGQYNDACTSFEFIMQEKPDFKTGFHLILSYYALADREDMKQSFIRLLNVAMATDDLEKILSHQEDSQWSGLKELLRTDQLHRLERQLQSEAERCILMAAKLISPVIEDSFAAGYHWCVEAIKESAHAHLADDLEINKAVLFLRQRDVTQALDTLRSFEKRGDKMAANAAINLSTIFFLQGDLPQAEKYADMGRESDPYSAGAFVCLGNCYLARGDLAKSKDYFVCALENDSSCVEALYNLGLTHRLTGQLDQSLSCFGKLQTVLRHQPEILCQMANLNEDMGDVEQAIEWYLQLLTAVPSDPGVLQKLGELFDRLGDRQQAFQYYSESHRHYPSNMRVIRWLATYYTDMQVLEKAIVLYDRAAKMKPKEAEWQLSMASCTLRLGNYHEALQLYKNIKTQFPNNMDCLRSLVKLSNDMGLKESAEYSAELRRLEQVQNEEPGSRRTSSRLGLSAAKGSRLNSAVGSDLLGTGFRSGQSSAQSVPDRKPFTPPTVPVDTTFNDTLGPLRERPITSRRLGTDSEFADVEIGDDLLPL